MILRIEKYGASTATVPSGVAFSTNRRVFFRDREKESGFIIEEEGTTREFTASQYYTDSVSKKAKKGGWCDWRERIEARLRAERVYAENSPKTASSTTFDQFLENSGVSSVSQSSSAKGEFRTASGRLQFHKIVRSPGLRRTSNHCLVCKLNPQSVR